jgi:hypothetical protein
MSPEYIIAEVVKVLFSNYHVEAQKFSQHMQLVVA